MLTVILFNNFFTSVNECENDNGGCAQGCVDTLASYTCSCNDGYILDVDKKGCIGKFEYNANLNTARNK